MRPDGLQLTGRRATLLDMYIGELERRTGVSRAKIRAWLKQGLLPPVAQDGTWTDFSDDYQSWVLAVEALYRAGRETDEIKRTMKYLRGEPTNSVDGDRRHEIVLAMDVLDAEIEAIAQCKRALNQVLKRSFRPADPAAARPTGGVTHRSDERLGVVARAANAVGRPVRAFWRWAVGPQRKPGPVTPIAR